MLQQVKIITIHTSHLMYWLNERVSRVVLSERSTGEATAEGSFRHLHKIELKQINKPTTSFWRNLSCFLIFVMN
jgi:hypothetical protein